jgi:hypothetical protein
MQLNVTSKDLQLALLIFKKFPAIKHLPAAVDLASTLQLRANDALYATLKGQQLSIAIDQAQALALAHTQPLPQSSTTIAQSLSQLGISLSSEPFTLSVRFQPTVVAKAHHDMYQFSHTALNFISNQVVIAQVLTEYPNAQNPVQYLALTPTTADPKQLNELKLAPLKEVRQVHRAVADQGYQRRFNQQLHQEAKSLNQGLKWLHHLQHWIQHQSSLTQDKLSQLKPWLTSVRSHSLNKVVQSLQPNQKISDLARVQILEGISLGIWQKNHQLQLVQKQLNTQKMVHPPPHLAPVPSPAQAQPPPAPMMHFAKPLSLPETKLIPPLEQGNAAFRILATHLCNDLSNFQKKLTPAPSLGKKSRISGAGQYRALAPRLAQHLGPLIAQKTTLQQLSPLKVSQKLHAILQTLQSLQNKMPHLPPEINRQLQQLQQDYQQQLAQHDQRYLTANTQRKPR